MGMIVVITLKHLNRRSEEIRTSAALESLHESIQEMVMIISMCSIVVVTTFKECLSRDQCLFINYIKLLHFP